MVSAELRKRTAHVYLPSEEMKERWENEAEEQRISLSSWVQHVVNRYCHRRGDRKEKRELMRELDEAQDRIRELERDLRAQKALVEKLERQLES